MGTGAGAARRFISRLSLRERVLFFLTAASLLFGAFFYFFLPHYRESRALSLQRGALLVEIAQLETQSTALAAAAQQRDERQVSPRKSPALRVLDEGVPRLLEKITRTERVGRIEFMSIRPGEVQDTGRYMTLPLAVELHSELRELREYLRILEDLPIIRVETIRISVSEKTNPSLRVEMTLTVYLGKG